MNNPFSSIDARLNVIENLLLDIKHADKESVLSKQPAEPTLPELITRKEAAKFLGISLPTLHRYTQEGVIPAYRLGAHVRYKADELKTSLTAMYNAKRKGGRHV